MTYDSGMAQFNVSAYGKKTDPRLAGLFRKPTGESGTERSFNPSGEILGKNQHIGFKTTDVLTLTSFFDKNRDGNLTRSELNRGISLLGKFDSDKDSETAMGLALDQLDFETDKNSDIPELEQKRQIAGSILQTMKDFFHPVASMGDSNEDAISTKDLLALNKLDYHSRVLIDGESDVKAKALSERYITNADMWGALGLSGTKDQIKTATDSKNIPSFNTYKTNADKVNKSNKNANVQQLIQLIFSLLLQGMSGGGYGPPPTYGGQQPQQGYGNQNDLMSMFGSMLAGA